MHEPNIARINKKGAIEFKTKKLKEKKAIFQICFKLNIPKTIRKTIYRFQCMSRSKSSQPPTAHAIGSAGAVCLKKRKILTAESHTGIDFYRYSHTGEYSDHQITLSHSHYPLQFCIRFYKPVEIFIDKV